MIVYDCEIIKGIAKKDEERLPDIEYCEGWRDFSNMGISTICAYDFNTRRYHVFLKDNFEQFQKLVDETELIIGFNSLAFDNPLCRANGINVPDEKSWDLLVEIWAGAGLSRTFEYPTHVGFSLDACSEANFGTKKSGNGALAPVDWQRGKYGTVIDYCVNDIKLTKELVTLVIEIGGIWDPRTPGQRIDIAPPQLPQPLEPQTCENCESCQA